ncbi:hypothetical protein ISCGN_000778 [Ixodes scapularis]
MIPGLPQTLRCRRLRSLRGVAASPARPSSLSLSPLTQIGCGRTLPLHIRANLRSTRGGGGIPTFNPLQSRGVFVSETFRQRPQQSIARSLEAGGRKTAFLFRRLNSETRCATRQTRDRTRAPETERLLRDDLLRKTNAPAGFVRRGKPEAELPATCCAPRCNGDACQLAYCQHKTWHRDARNNDK